MFTFNIKGDYKAEFKVYVDKLIKQENAKKDEGTLDRPARIAEIDTLINVYVDTVGERPSTTQLSRLTHLILMEELKDKDPHKRKKSESPFLSSSQVMRIQNTEASMEFAEKCIGSDGKSYGDGKRRKRTKYENMVVDGDFKHLTAEDKVVTAAG